MMRRCRSGGAGPSGLGQPLLLKAAPAWLVTPSFCRRLGCCGAFWAAVRALFALCLARVERPSVSVYASSSRRSSSRICQGPERWRSQDCTLRPSDGRLRQLTPRQGWQMRCEAHQALCSLAKTDRSWWREVGLVKPKLGGEGPCARTRELATLEHTIYTSRSGSSMQVLGRSLITLGGVATRSSHTSTTFGPRTSPAGRSCLWTTGTSTFS